MRILIILPYYKPGYRAGGPIQSIFNLSKLLSKNYEIFVLTQNHDLGDKKYSNIVENKWINFEGHQVMYLDQSEFTIGKILFVYKTLSPSFIYFNSFFDTRTYRFLFLNLFKKLNTKIIIAPRGELDSGALSIKSSKKNVFLKVIKFFITDNIIFHATTLNEQENIQRILKSDSIIAENVPNLILKKPERVDKEINQTNIVFISRISPKKNLLYAIEILSKVKVEGLINFDIIGPIEDTEYWNKINLFIKNSIFKNVTINYRGEIPNQDLLKETKKYHFLFFPTLAENYGHIIYECLSFGLPVILSNNTPWNEMDNGIFVRSLNDHKKFTSLIETLHQMNTIEFLSISDKAFHFAKNKIDLSDLLNSYKILFNANNQK